MEMGEKYYLDKLEEQGAIKKGENKNRAIEIVEKKSNLLSTEHISEDEIVSDSNADELFANLIKIPM